VSPFHASEHADIISVFPSVHVAGNRTAINTETAVESVCPLSITSPPQLYTHQHACKEQKQTSVIFTAMMVIYNKLQCSQINIPARYITQTDFLTHDSWHLKKTLQITPIQYISNVHPTLGVVLYTSIRCDIVFTINRHLQINYYDQMELHIFHKWITDNTMRCVTERYIILINWCILIYAPDTQQLFQQQF